MIKESLQRNPLDCFNKIGLLFWLIVKKNLITIVLVLSHEYGLHSVILCVSSATLDIVCRQVTLLEGMSFAVGDSLSTDRS